MSDNSKAEGCLAIGTILTLLALGMGACTLRQTTYTPNVACEVINAENVRSGRRGENKTILQRRNF